MEDLSLFVKVHLAVIVVSVLAVIASIVILYLLKNNPAKLGFTEKPTWKGYLLAVAPLTLVAFALFQIDAEGLSYPTAIVVHRNTVVVDGVVTTLRHSTINDETYTEESSKTILFDKTTGKEIANLIGFTPNYCAGGRMLGSANFGYHIVDLATGEVLRVVSEDDIKASVGSYVGEKIYSIELKQGANCFNVRTMRDNKFIYDPILEDDVKPETHIAFYNGFSNEKFESKKLDLFLAEKLGTTKDGTTLVLSYDDLEKRVFILSAISPGGEVLWTKRDFEISPKLEDQKFVSEGIGKNTVLDDQNFYFVTKGHLVCASLTDGQLKWIVRI